MKNILIKLSSLLLFVGVLTSCEEDKVIYNGGDIIMFSDTAKEVAVSEDAGQIEFKILLSKEYQSDVTVNFEVVDDTAIQGTHYTITSSSVVIPAGESEGNIVINLVNDSEGNDSRKFDLKLTDSSISDAVLGLGGEEGTFFKTVTIANDDCPSKFNFWAGPLTVDYWDNDPYETTLTGAGILSGECDILILDVPALSGFDTVPGDNKYRLTFIPSDESGTSGTVEVENKLVNTGQYNLGGQPVDLYYVVTYGSFDTTSGEIYIEFTVAAYFLDGTDAGASLWSGTNTITKQ